ncbi:hypothetical protein [Pseudomonas chlororaphis]|uniref:hypothetical protein n=1 Tax=Pseudomonas chlororaphis TaxID=587753 RepID=UPI000F56D585|nr:hypothetical protein [Pseudomonas chlororaphis]
MTANTFSRLASRTGYALGRLVSSGAPLQRWGVRAILGVAAAVLLLAFGSWLAAAGMTLFCIGLILFALAKGDFSVLRDLSESEERKAPYGRDVFGAELDCWGNVDGETPEK